MVHQECTAFCGQPCEYENRHHPLLRALIQSSGKSGYIQFKHEVRRLELTTKWKKNDPIPDPCPEFNYPIVHWAAVLGKTRVLQWCIDEQLDLLQTCGNRSETALHRLVVCGYTALSQNSENVYQLFEDVVDLLEILLDCRDDNHDLPLHVATKLLVEQQGKINQFFYSIYSKMVEILAQKTSQMHEDLLDSCNMDGNTPLHILAASDKSSKLVKTLLDYGADIDIKNIEGETPLDIAKSHGARNVLKLLSKVAKKNRSLLDLNFIEQSDGESSNLPESDESSECPDSQLSGRIYASDCDSDINHHESDHYDQEYLDNMSESSTESLTVVKCDWTNMDKSPSFIHSYENALDDTRLKRKASSYEVEAPMKKKLKEKRLPNFAKKWCPTVAIAPIQIPQPTRNKASLSPAIGGLKRKSDNIDDISLILKHGIKSLPGGVQHKSAIDENGWISTDDVGNSTDNMELCDIESQAMSPEVAVDLSQSIASEQRREELRTDSSQSMVKCKRGIEDIVKIIKQRHECDQAPNNSTNSGLNVNERTESLSESKGSSKSNTVQELCNSNINNVKVSTESLSESNCKGSSKSNTDRALCTSNINNVKVRIAGLISESKGSSKSNTAQVLCNSNINNVKVSTESFSGGKGSSGERERSNTDRAPCNSVKNGLNATAMSSHLMVNRDKLKLNKAGERSKGTLGYPMVWDKLSKNGEVSKGTPGPLVVNMDKLNRNGERTKGTPGHLVVNRDKLNEADEITGSKGTPGHLVVHREELVEDGDVTKQFPGSKGTKNAGYCKLAIKQTTEPTFTGSKQNIGVQQHVVDQRTECQGLANNRLNQSRNAEINSTDNIESLEVDTRTATSSVEKVIFVNESEEILPEVNVKIEKEDTTTSKKTADEVIFVNESEEFLPGVNVKIEKEDTTTSKSSTSDEFENLKSVFSEDDVMELLEKTKKKAIENIEKFTGELEDASRNERVQYQQYTTLQQRIQRQEEQIKQQQEEVAKWTKEADIICKGRELATRKKIDCQEKITIEKRKLPKIENLLSVLK